jgi:hypothetical protein
MLRERQVYRHALRRVKEHRRLLLHGLVVLAASVLLQPGCRTDPSALDSPPARAAATPAPTSTGADAMAAAAAFLETLDAAQRARVQFPFESAGRYDWHYVPRAREGLSLGEMSLPQRDALHALLRSALSREGYAKATGVVSLEGILGELTGAPGFRDAGRYHVTVFGAPGGGAAWGWRFEGHHLSLNYTSVTDALVATTPAFLGANPARVPSGPRAGWRVLADEEDRARRLLLALDPEQRARTVLSPTAPRDIVTGADRKVRLARFEGLPAAAMTAPQRDSLFALVETYVRNQHERAAGAWMTEIRAADPDSLFFAWAGGDAPGEGHYYRIHGPVLLIEYDNTQGGANHVHTVVRDPRGDFGEDLLRRHYEAHRH